MPSNQRQDTYCEGTREHEGRRATSISSPATAIWNQRERLASLASRFKALNSAVGRPTDLFLYQWIQIVAFALEFHPDVIIELGRGAGNSTSCFLEVANQLGGPKACRFISLCLSDTWFKRTVPRLKKIVREEWFAPGETVQGNILEYDFSAALKGARRCFVFWDAHGFEVAECVLGNLLPKLAEKAHVVVMHDLSDTRYDGCNREYGEVGLWKGTNAEEPCFWIGHIFSRVAQAISVLDFSTRNDMPFHSAAESMSIEIAGNPTRLAALKALLGDDLFSLRAQWFWFSLNEAPGSVVFPPYRRSLLGTQDERLRVQGEELLNRVASLKRSLETYRKQSPWLGAEAEKLTIDIEDTLDTINWHEDMFQDVAKENRELRLCLQREESSVGGRALKACRNAFNRLAPTGSWQRGLYDAFFHH